MASVPFIDPAEWGVFMRAREAAKRLGYKVKRPEREGATYRIFYPGSNRVLYESADPEAILEWFD